MFRSAFLKPFYVLFIVCFILMFFSSCFIIPVIGFNSIEMLPIPENIEISEKGYAWPTPRIYQN